LPIAEARTPGCTAARSPEYLEKQTDAGLWRKRHRGRPVIARAVLAALIAVVALAMGGQVINPEFDTLAVIEHPKAVVVGIIENVLVPNESDDKEGGFTVPNSIVEVFGKGLHHLKYGDVAAPSDATSGPFFGISLHEFEWPERIIEGRNLCIHSGSNIFGWRLPDVLQLDSDFGLLADFEIFDFGQFDVDVSPKLALGGFVRASYEADSRAPKHEGDDRQKPFTRLDAKNFARVLAAALTLIFATWIYLRGWTLIGWIAAAYAIFGLMLRIDLWSSAVRVIHGP
jgi:hypothetical protein